MSELESRCHKLKLEIKQWEYDFREKHGRVPSKEDVKGNKEVSRKYKKYQLYKGQLKRATEPDPFTTPKKERRAEHFPLTPSEGSQKQEEVERQKQKENRTPVGSEDEEEVEEYIGPTPQLNGRVLGLFDLEDSPVKKSTPRRVSPQKESSPKQVLATPTKSSSPMMSELMETPSYLKRVSTSDPFSNSPKKFCRSLSNLIAELREMKESGAEIGPEVTEKGSDDEYEEIDDGFSEHLGEVEGDVGDNRDRIYKKKGQKRTTRRVVMRPKLNEQDLEQLPEAEEAKPRRATKKPEENYRRLKLMNSGHRGAPRNSRFRRRR